MKNVDQKQTDRHHSKSSAECHSSTEQQGDYLDDYRTEAIAQQKLVESINNSPRMLMQQRKSHALFGQSTQLQYGIPAQKVADITGGNIGVCGPSVLSDILDTLGGDAKSAAEITTILIDTLGSEVGEIFTYNQLEGVAEALDMNTMCRNFNSVDTLLVALQATGENPVMAAISNVGFPGKENADYDQQLITAGREWVRAHWIAITDFDAEASTITYKDNQHNVGQTASLLALNANNQLLGDQFNWGQWAVESGNEQPKRTIGRTYQMDLTGYIVEFTLA